MKIKLRDIRDSLDAIHALGNNENISASLGYRLRRVFPRVDDEMRAFEATRANLLKKYGEPQMIKNSKGKEVPSDVYEVKRDSEGFKPFIDEIESVLDEEVDMTKEVKEAKLKITDLEKDKIKMKPIQMASISWLFITK